MTTKTKEVEELQYFRRISALYEKAAPIVGYIAAPEFLKRGLLPVSPRSMVESNITLQMILQAVKKGSKPQNKQLVSIERDFEIALSNCIKAAEASERFIDLTDYHRDGVFFGQIINAAVLAHEYIESVHQKLNDFEFNSKNIQKEPITKVVSTEKLITDKRILLQKHEHQVESDVKHSGANFVEVGLDRLGDGIIFIGGKIQNAFTFVVNKSNFKKT